LISLRVVYEKRHNRRSRKTIKHGIKTMPRQKELVHVCGKIGYISDCGLKGIPVCRLTNGGCGTLTLIVIVTFTTKKVMTQELPKLRNCKHNERYKIKIVRPTFGLRDDKSSKNIVVTTFGLRGDKNRRFV
jgi:hypothetical protein